MARAIRRRRGRQTSRGAGLLRESARSPIAGLPADPEIRAGQRGAKTSKGRAEPERRRRSALPGAAGARPSGLCAGIRAGV